MKWSEEISVSCHDTDINGIVRPSPILRYMQEAANLQLHNLGPSNEYLRENGMAFILARADMRLYKPLYAYDKIIAQSWACDSNLTSFYRCGRVLKDGETAADLVSVWALLDIKTRRFKRASEIKPNFETDEMLRPDFHIRMPRDIKFASAGERRISYSDVDLNRHMNNTNYPDMLCDYIDDMSGKRPVSITINFLSEAAIGETVRVNIAKSGSIYYFRTEKQNGAIGIDAILELTQI